MKKAMPVLTAVLLVLAVTCGTVGANALLTGADVKNGSLTGSDIKAGSLGASVLSATARSELHGQKGSTGSQGAAGRAGAPGDTGASGVAGAVGAIGATGATGATGAIGVAGAPGVNGSNGTNGTNGANGTVTPLVATNGLVALVTSAPLAPVVSLSVPAGKYVVLAKTQLTHSGAADTVTCTLQSGSTTIDQSAIKTLPALASVAVPLQAVTTVVTSPTLLTVQCIVAVANGSANFSSLIAIPTA
jgi:hypothetical protein